MRDQTREQGLICKIGIDFENNNVSTFIHAQIAPLIKLPIKQSHSNCNVQMGKWSHKKLLICHSVIWIVTSLPADLDLPYYLWVMLPSCSNAQGYRHKQSNLQIAASGNSCTELDFTSLAQLLVSFEKTYPISDKWLCKFMLLSKSWSDYRKRRFRNCNREECKLLNCGLMLWQEWVPYSWFQLLENLILKPLKTL